MDSSSLKGEKREWRQNAESECTLAQTAWTKVNRRMKDFCEHVIGMIITLFTPVEIY